MLSWKDIIFVFVVSFAVGFGISFMSNMNVEPCCTCVECVCVTCESCK